MSVSLSNNQGSSSGERELRLMYQMALAAPTPQLAAYYMYVDPTTQSTGSTARSNLSTNNVS
jgi:hypothetical protein